MMSIRSSKVPSAFRPTAPAMRVAPFADAFSVSNFCATSSRLAPERMTGPFGFWSMITLVLLDFVIVCVLYVALIVCRVKVAGFLPVPLHTLSLWHSLHKLGDVLTLSIE